MFTHPTEPEYAAPGRGRFSHVPAASATGRMSWIPCPDVDRRTKAAKRACAESATRGMRDALMVYPTDLKLEYFKIRQFEGSSRELGDVLWHTSAMS